MSQPRRELRFLLRLQINAVVDALDRLAVGPFRCFDLVRGEKVNDLIAHVRITEGVGCTHDFSAGKNPAGFLHRIPVCQDKIPGQSFSIRIAHHT